MLFEYIPQKGFKTDTLSFNWGEDRETLRKKFNHAHKASNTVLELAQYYDGDKSKNIEQRRDIYENYAQGNNYFFLNYDTNDRLRDVEIHWGVYVMIEEVRLEFGREMSECITELKKLDASPKEIEEGNYLFTQLKITIADNNSMGGEGNGLGYFFASSDISHLEE